MHELGVVFYVIKDVKSVAEENHVKRVSSVTVELGEVSAVIPEYLTDCWNWARKKEPVMQDAELKIERLDAVSFCEDCSRKYPTVEFAKICPCCGSEHTFLLRGNEFNIKEIEVED
jgi:hydrogenase nickel incorporation protein HypA/HybF